MSFNFMATVTICSDFAAPQNNSDTVSTVSPSISHEVVVGRGRPPYRAPRAGSCLTLGKELTEETRADKARDFIGKGHLGGEQQGKETQENCSATCHVARSLGFYGNGISFWVVFGQSF